MKRPLLLIFALAIAASAFALKVYINPGHGDWDSGARPMATINYPLSGGFPDTLGFYESNTNLWKCFYLQKKLQNIGVSVKMSRTATGPFPRNSSNQTYNKALSTIASEAENYACDHFISVHSNAADEGTNTNYALILYRGTTGSPKVSGSDSMSKAVWDELVTINRKGFEYYTAYTSSRNVVGDLTFYGKPSTNYGYLGVLKHSRRGYLSEGYFHTYQPSRHRGLNPDWCCQEGLRYFRGIVNHHGLTKDTKGYIMGEIKDKSKSVSHNLYKYNSNTTDKYYPINGAKVMLKNSAGEVIKTNCYPYVKKMLKDQNWYTTDHNYNGIFVFENLAPGTYTYSVHKSGYADATGTLTVSANQTTYTTIYMTAGQGTEPSVGPDVTWELNGGTVSGTLPTTITSTYTIPTPTKTGYRFLGWYNTNNTSGTKYTTLSVGFKGKLYAVWEEIINYLNPFAYNLSHEFSADSTEIKLHFYINAPATNVKLIFNDGEQDYVARDYNNVKEGGYSTKLSTSMLPRGKKITWRADVKGAEVTAPLEVKTKYSVYHPTTVDVDNNPENATFGTILTNEAEQAVKSTTGYLGSDMAQVYMPLARRSNLLKMVLTQVTTAVRHLAQRLITMLLTVFVYQMMDVSLLLHKIITASIYGKSIQQI